jgi:hypothetical protein
MPIYSPAGKQIRAFSRIFIWRIALRLLRSGKRCLMLAFQN